MIRLVVAAFLVAWGLAWNAGAQGATSRWAGLIVFLLLALAVARPRIVEGRRLGLVAAAGLFLPFMGLGFGLAGALMAAPWVVAASARAWRRLQFYVVQGGNA